MACVDSRITARALTQALGGWRTRDPAYEALADGIRLLCLDTRLAPRTALPAERELAAALRVSRTTVAAAYRSLRDTQHIESLRGSGSVTLPLGRRGAGRVAAEDDAIDLQQASPAAWPGLAGIISETALDAASLVARAGYDLVGAPALREAIAQRYARRGIATEPDQILVTTGAQAAIDLLAAVLVRRGDRAVAETPTYPHAAESLRAAGARLVAVPVSVDAGWDIDRAEQAFARTTPVLAYLMPQFQNPTGRSMSQYEADAFAAAARRAGTTLILDETTGELAIDASGPVALLHDADIVRIGSLGKTVWGGLRVGWIRADHDLIRRLVAARPRRDLGTPEFEQAVAARLLPRMDDILGQRAQLLGAGRDALTAALRSDVPSWRVPDVAGGVSLWVDLGARLSTGLVLAARAHGLYLSSGPRFAVDGGHDRFLRVPFTAPVDDLRRAVDILARVWPAVREGAPAQTPDLFAPVV